MKPIMTSLSLAAVLVVSSVTQGFAADGSVSRAACPAREKGESSQDYGQRKHDYCEIRWRDMVATHETGGQTHDQFIPSCSRKCSAMPLSSGELYLLLGTGIAVGFALANNKSDNPSPASP